ncbi:pentatricopeptide repeat-containing protein-like [Dorcoceras hygrometricum]|uniref:Pentatricopeptide repeat-containing protein-like n=1 Tax=Dorcoceras hygrometricum TaxID=472368 RepID=A0A2Z7AL49_9LAMI|nr:pentatricopeptide repeat-containing protein-like [Dorcoceras hygrometricum]
MDNTIPQAQGIPRLTVLVHICFTLTGTLYPPPGAPTAGSKPRPSEKPGKPENTYRQQYTSPRGTSGSNPSTESNTNSIRKATDKYANSMQGIKATTEDWEPKDLNKSSTARSDQRNGNQFVATGILSTWELPTHLQYTIPDAKQT